MTNNQKAARELLPCPFCGHTPRIGPEDQSRDGDAWAFVECNNGKCPVMVRVEIYTERAPFRKVAAAWNSRKKTDSGDKL